MTLKPLSGHDRTRRTGRVRAAVTSGLTLATVVVALTFARSPVNAVVPPTTEPPTTSDPTIGEPADQEPERLFTLTFGGTNPAVPGWTSMTGPNYELWSDGSLYFRGPADADRLYPETLVAVLDEATTAHLVELIGAIDMETVGGTTEYSTTLSHPPVAILVVGDGTADDTFTSYRIAESGDVPATTTALVALIDELDALVGTTDAQPLASGRAIVVAQPTTAGDAEPSAWPAPVDWAAMAPSIGDARCALIEGDEVAAAIDAYEIPHSPQRAFDTGDGTIVVTGVRMLMPSEAGCPPPS